MAVAAAWTRVGIDIGSARTVAVVCRNDGFWQPLSFDGQPWLPSGVYRSGTGKVLTGAQAMAAAMADPGGYLPDPAGRISAEAVRLGVDAVPGVHLVGAVVRRVLEEAERVCGGPLPEAVVVVPPGWSRSGRGRMLRQAAQYAGVREPVLAPAAAAVAAAGNGFDVPVARWTVVCDLGAHATVSVVQRTGTGDEVLAELDADAGGHRIDELLSNHLSKHLATQMGVHQAVHATPQTAERTSTPPAGGPDQHPGTPGAGAATVAVSEDPTQGAEPDPPGPVGTGMSASAWATRMVIRTAKEATAHVPAALVALPAGAVGAGRPAAAGSTVPASATSEADAATPVAATPVVAGSGGREVVGDGTIVVTAEQVLAVAAPVIDTVAGLVRKAVQAAEVDAATGCGLILVGGTAAIAGIGEKIQTATGLTVRVPRQPELATVCAAAHAGRYEAPDSRPSNRLPGVLPGVRSEVAARLGVGTGPVPLPGWPQLLAVLIPGLASLLLAVQAITSAYVTDSNWLARNPGYLAVNEGQLAMAAVLAVVAATAIGGHYTLQPRPGRISTARRLPDGLPAATGLLSCVGFGVVLAALYASLGAAYHEGAFAGQLMWSTVVPAIPIGAVIAAGAVLILRGAPEPRIGWGRAFTVPHPPIVLGGIGMATITWSGNATDPWTVQQWWFAVVPHCGGLLLGLAIAFLLAERRLFQILIAAPLSITTFLIGTFGPANILGMMWVVAVGCWWIRRVWQIGTYGIPDDDHPDTAWT